MSESLDRYLKEFKEKIKDVDDKFAKDIDLYWEQTIKLFDDDNVSFMKTVLRICLLYTSPSPRDATLSRMPSWA